jgi:predicted nucleotidyltransferase
MLTDSEHKLRAVLARHPQLAFAVLVGSRASGRAHAQSDWDIAVRWAYDLDLWTVLGLGENLRHELAQALEVALPPMLLQQPHLDDHHAAVHRLAHVVDRQQRHLHGGQGFHLDAGLAEGLGGARVQRTLLLASRRARTPPPPGSARSGGTAGSGRGALGALDAGDARDAQHVALLRGAAAGSAPGGGLHADAAFGHRHAVGAGLGADVDHVGLALGVEVGQRLEGGCRTCRWADVFARALRKPGAWRHHTGMPLEFRPLESRRAAPLAGCPAGRCAAAAPVGRLASPVGRALPSLGDGARDVARPSGAWATSIAREPLPRPGLPRRPGAGRLSAAALAAAAGRGARARRSCPPSCRTALAWQPAAVARPRSTPSRCRAATWACTWA